jgi:four helix bundle protein
LPKTLPNYEVGKQLVRSSGSIGANYIEANELLSKKDFIMGVKICREESKESRDWLQFVKVMTDYHDKERNLLVQ